MALHSRDLDELAPAGAVEGLFPEPMRVFRVPDPVPRAYAVAGVRIADGEAAVQALLDPAFDPRREIVLPSGPVAPADGSFRGSTRLVAHEADRVALEAELSERGYVVLVDAWDPAWRAEVDGRPVELLRANVAFRAVAVPAGRHRIEMRYRPATLPWGLGISGLGLVAGVALAAPRRRATS